jgi:hypothetical protein
MLLLTGMEEGTALGHVGVEGERRIRGLMSTSQIDLSWRRGEGWLVRCA